MRLFRPIVTGLALLTLPVTAQGAPTVTLRRGFKPNPTIIRGRTQIRDQSLRRVFNTRSNCSGFVAARPDAVVNLPRGLGRVTMRFSGMGKVHIKLPGNRYICGSQRITMNPWPAGRLEIRSAMYSGRRNRVGPFTISVEDAARPRNLGWNKNIKTVALTNHLATPILAGGTARPEARIPYRGSSNCSSTRAPRQPRMLLKVSRPLTDIHFRLASNGRARLVLVGPLNPTNRNIRTVCHGEKGKLGRLEPGTYALKVGVSTRYRGAAKATAYNLVLRTPKTRLTPLAPSTNIPRNPPVRDRIIDRYYPQLDKDYWRSTATLQKLFAVAPKQLFIFPAFDLDKASAKAIPFQPKNIAYPRKGEPLLLFGNRLVVAADGAVFSVVKYSYLKRRPNGPISLPRTARNNFLRPGWAITKAAREDQRAIRKYRQALKRERRCVDRVWRPTNRTVNALRRRAWSRWRARRIQTLKDRTASRAFRVCGTKRLRRSYKRLHKRLLRTRAKRRTARLKKIRGRLSRMFR